MTKNTYVVNRYFIIGGSSGIDFDFTIFEYLGF